MSLKLKALGLGLLAAMAVGAFGVISAGASGTGHFTNDAPGGDAVIDVTQIGAPGTNEFFDTGLETGVTCETKTGTATVDDSTETAVTITNLAFNSCHPTIGGSATVHTNGCDFLATIGTNPTTTDQPLHLQCPAGKEMTLTVDPPIVGTCTIHVPPQTSKGGAKFTTGVFAGKHDVTMHINTTEVTNNKTESGFGCFGTAGHNTESEMFTSWTLRATFFGFPINLTARGPNGEE